ncbi:MAG: UTP--glucose-1-phosphate uridylyltransferase GalU, partial [Rickettsiales bacterium]|nr:UTP--glucose-1-phosphate uridylyltransferase GalU [Rickettsiales bacterium]
MSSKIRKVVFPVGGLGTRFLPATKSMPKEMLPVNTKPLIQYAFEEAQKAGIEEFIFITGRNKNAISNHFDHAYELQSVLTEKEKQELLVQTKDWLPTAGNIAFVRQQAPLGLGHAVWCARNFIGDEPFAVMLADELILSQKGMLAEMVEAYEKVGGNIIGLHEVPNEHTDRYGIAKVDTYDESMCRIDKMVEKPKIQDAPSNLALIGRYILQPEIFTFLENQKRGSGGEIQLTDSMQSMLDDDGRFYGVVSSGNRYDCGNRIGFLEANIAFSL